MHEKRIHRARVVSSVAATAIALACGTNYVYSAWAPQFADKLQLSTTQANLIGLSGNLGMYLPGVPVGMFVDAKGPRSAVLFGAVMLGLGYFPLRQAFQSGADSWLRSVPLLCIFSFLSGFGGCMAFAASVKTSAINWPHHRGTATAFPMAAFGLSAFFFAVVGSLLFPGDTGGFLLLLAFGTAGLTAVGFFFVRVLPHHATAHTSHEHYHAVAGADGESLGDSQRLRRTVSAEAKAKAAVAAARSGSNRFAPYVEEPGRSPGYDPEETDREEAAEDEDERGSGSTDAAVAAAEASPSVEPGAGARQYATMADAAYRSSAAASPAAALDAVAGSSSSAHLPAEDADQDSMDETSSLMSKASSLPGDVLVQNSVDMDRSHRIDIRGWALLRNVEFWQFFVIMGILSGIGLMTINNIGHDANALWKYYDKSVDSGFLVARQQMHVSILSVGSFTGRLLSGVGSDFLVKRLQASRAWCLAVAAAVFVIAQLCAISITNPHLLFFVSGLTGIAYGFLFGAFPSLVAESFGIHGLSQNWGLMTLSPVLSSNAFNLFYGVVFDHHSTVGPTGERWCAEGIACYRAAYMVTLVACFVGLAITLLVIRHQHLQRLKETGKRSLED